MPGTCGSKFGGMHLTSPCLAGSCYMILRNIPILWNSALNVSLVDIQNMIPMRLYLGFADGGCLRCCFVSLGLTHRYSICPGSSVSFSLEHVILLKSYRSAPCRSVSLATDNC